MAGARIDAALWNKFAATAKMNGKSVAEALEAALRAALPANQKAKRWPDLPPALPEGGK
jgi:hypothetical protein